MTRSNDEPGPRAAHSQFFPALKFIFLTLLVLCAAWPVYELLIDPSESVDARSHERSAVTAPGSAAIPIDDFGAKATREYKGDGLEVRATPTGARLRSEFQRLTGDATRGGLWITSTVPGEAAHLRLIADSVGRGDSMATLPRSGAIVVSANGAVFARPGLTEEYTTSVNGVRQDFIVDRKPAGAGTLQVDLALTGATAASSSVGATLTLEGSRRELSYSGLHVTDATGRALDANLDVTAPDRLAVRVDDAGAVYPVRIDPTFSDSDWGSMSPGRPGTNGAINAVTSDSAGNVYIGGTFTLVGSVKANRIAKWDGTTWTPLGTGMNNTVTALLGNGIDVYAGGAFVTAGGVTVNRIARWDGSQWMALGTGVSGNVSALLMSSGTLYVGGAFATAGGVTVNNLARWSGSAWSAIGSTTVGTNNTVSALAMIGSNLYVGGNFSTAGGVAAASIAKWNGSAWSAVGTGTTNAVFALAASGTTLYVGGNFIQAGGINAPGIAQWNEGASTWSKVGGGGTNNTAVSSIAVNGGDLYIGGSFTSVNGSSSPVAASYIAKWNSSTGWSAVSGGVNWWEGIPSVNALAMVNGTLYAGGSFTRAGTSAAANLAAWDGSSWSGLGPGFSARVRAMALSGTTLYVGGDFQIGGVPGANSIAMWNGTSWSALGTGVNGPIAALAASGSTVYAGGQFTTAGGVAAANVAKWNGSTWSAMGAGTDAAVQVLHVSGTDVFMGGWFSTPGFKIAKWNGSSWSALGSGLNGNVYALAGTSTNLYAAGGFTASGALSLAKIARWNGTAWSALGTGIVGEVQALALNGSDLYVGGNFTSAGGVAGTQNVAKWNSGWSSLSTGAPNPVRALATVGSDLFAGGDFVTIGGVAASRIAKWDGSAWSPVGSGISSGTRVLALQSDTAGNLIVGGDFDLVGAGMVSPMVAVVGPASNVPPTANAGADQTLEASSPSGAGATLDGSASSDPNGTPLTYEWKAGATVVGTTTVLNVTVPIGSTTYTLTVSDGNASSSDTVVVTVQDTFAPSIAIATPAPGASFMQHQVVAASYSCADTASSVTTCSGTVATGANIDTATGGTKTFTVTAVDSRGNTATTTFTYTVIEPTPQSITFGQPADANYGDSAVAFNVTASSGLPVTLTSNSPAVCTVGTTATILGVGTCSITASQEGNTQFAAAAAVTRTFAVLPKALVAVLTAGGKIYDGTTSEPNASLSCTLTGVLEGDAGNVACTASNGSFDSPDAGARSVNASVAIGGSAAGNYSLGFTSATTGATIGQASSTTTVVCPVSAVYTGIALEICTATTSGAGGLSASPTVTYSGNVDAGTATAAATYAGDLNHTGSGDTASFTIDRAGQTVSFLPLAERNFGDADFSVTATATSGLPVTFASTGACTISGTIVHLDSAGTCSITASQGGNANYDPAADVVRSFNVRDVTPPVVTVGNDLAVEATGPAGAPVTFSASALDLVSGPLPAVCTIAGGSGSMPVSSGDTFAMGATLVTCAAVDFSGNTGVASFTVTVADSTAPALSVADVTETAANPAGTSVSYSPQAIDAVDPAPAVTCSPTSGSNFQIGTTEVSCTATDSTGNSTSQTFDVHVLDGVLPVLTAPAIPSTEATSSGGAVVAFDVTATDNYDATVSVECAPLSGSTFAVGATNVHCVATDQAGNIGFSDFNVTVTDTTGPALSLASVSAIATSGTGAAVTYTASSLDIVDGSIIPACSPASGAIFPIGTTTVECLAVDSRGNETTGNFSVVVHDGSAPVVAVPSDITLEATSPAGAVAIFSASATDNHDASLSTTCSPASGSTFALGSTTVNCSASDAANNTGSASFQMLVVDTTAPLLTVPAPISATAASSSGVAVTFTTAASDLVDGAVAVSCSPASGATFQPGTTGVSCTSADSRGNTTSASFTVVVTVVSSNQIGRFVAFSRDYTWLRENATVVTGDIGANERRYHNHQQVAEDDGREDVTVRVGQSAGVQQSGSRVVGSTVVMANKSSVGDVITNLLFNRRGTIRGSVTTSMTVPFLSLPVFPSVSAGTQTINVAKKRTLTLPPGAYGDVRIDNSATLVLTGGVYQFRSLTVAQQGTILLSGPSEVRILRDMRTKAKSRIILDQNQPGLSASQMVFYVAAADSDCTPDDPDDDGDDAGPVSVSIGQQSVVQAAIYAKNGTVWLRSKTQATGQFIGLHVRIGQRVTLTLASAFQ